MNCIHPIVVNGKMVPCQKCPVCLGKNRNDWSFRLRQEMGDNREHTFFCTLTYDDDHLPVASEPEYLRLHSIPNLSAGDLYFYQFRNKHNEKSTNYLGGQSFRKDSIYDPRVSELSTNFGILRRCEEAFISSDIGFQAEACFSPADIDRFTRYLRKLSRGVWHFRYFLVSEYGGSDEGTHRPHYHFILFTDFAELLSLRVLVDKAWRRGRTQVENISDGRIHYITKYALKDSDQFPPVGRHSACYPFRRFSARGLGHSYLEDDRNYDFHLNDNEHFRLWVNLNGDRRLRLPRYYRDRIFYSDDLQQIRRAICPPPFDPLYLSSLKLSWNKKSFYMDEFQEENILNKFKNHGKDKFTQGVISGRS